MPRIITVGAAPRGRIARSDTRAQVVTAASTTGAEPTITRRDLDLCASAKTTTFNFARHREPAHDRMIVERRGAIPPAWRPDRVDPTPALKLPF